MTPYAAGENSSADPGSGGEEGGETGAPQGLAHEDQLGLGHYVPDMGESEESNAWESDDGIGFEYGHHYLHDNIDFDSDEFDSEGNSEDQEEEEEEEDWWHMEAEDYQELNSPWVSHRLHTASAHLS